MFAVLGDGTFGFHMAEFETAVRRNLPFVAVVGTDARWNAEYNLQVRDYGANRAVGCELTGHPLRSRRDRAWRPRRAGATRRRNVWRHRARAGQRQAGLHQRHDRIDPRTHAPPHPTPRLTP